MTNEEVYIRERMGNRNPFTVPEGYFDHLADDIISKLPGDAMECSLSDSSSTIHRRTAVIRRLRPLLYAAACFAIAIFGITIYLNKNYSDDQLHVAQQQEQTIYSDTYIDEAADYAMLDNEDIYAGLLADI